MIWCESKADSKSLDGRRVFGHILVLEFFRFYPEDILSSGFIFLIERAGKMFTGIIEEMGRVKRLDKNGISCKLTIEADKVLCGSKTGDSIAVNGVCLTAVNIADKEFTADVMAETVRRSSLGALTKGSYVNLERAMAADGRFGGHIVSGHIDGTGEIKNISKEENAVWITIGCDAKILKYIIEKGSIAIDGISLTVAYVDDSCFKVSIIPHTLSETTLSKKKGHDVVTLDNDIFGKYVEKLLKYDDERSNEEDGARQSGLSMNFLAENGFI